MQATITQKAVFLQHGLEALSMMITSRAVECRAVQCSASSRSSKDVLEQMVGLKLSGLMGEWFVLCTSR